MRRVKVATRAGVHPDALPIFGGEARQRQIVQTNETIQEIAGWIEFNRQSSFREIDLHFVRALLEASANLHFVFAQQIVDEFLARVTWNVFRRIHEAERGRGNDGLLQGPVRVTLGNIEVAIRINSVAKWPGSQARHPPHVTRGERNLETVRRGVVQTMHTVGPKVMILALLAVGDDRGTRGLKLFDGVLDGRFIEGIQSRVRVVSSFGNRCKQFHGPGNASNGLGWDSHEFLVSLRGPQCK